MRIVYFLIAILGVSLLFPLGGRVRASELDDIRVRISPVLIEDEASPGETITRMVSIESLSQSILPVQIFAADVYSIDEAGRLGVDGNAGTSSAKDWFRFDREFILDPQVERQVEVTIVVPKTAQPGGRYVTVFVNPLVEGQNEPQSSKVSVQSQIGVLFFLTVKGDVVKRGEIADFSIPLLNLGSKVSMKTSLKNTGNVHLRPHSVITIRNILGLTKEEISVENSASLSALPGKIRTATISWDKAFPIGIYKAEVVISNGPGIRLTQSRWFVVFNFWLIIAGLLVGIFSVLYWYTNGKAVRRRKSARKILRRYRR